MKKANSRPAKGPRNQKFPSITMLMKVLLKKNIKYPLPKVVQEVKAIFPRSKFLANPERHMSWYRAAYKRGALKGVRP